MNDAMTPDEFNVIFDMQQESDSARARLLADKYVVSFNGKLSAGDYTVDPAGVGRLLTMEIDMPINENLPPARMRRIRREAAQIFQGKLTRWHDPVVTTTETGCTVFVEQAAR